MKLLHHADNLRWFSGFFVRILLQKKETFREGKWQKMAKEREIQLQFK